MLYMGYETFEYISQENRPKKNLDPNYYYEIPARNVVIEKPSSIDDVSSLLNFTMGRNSYFQTGIISPNVIIGRYCSIAHNVYLGVSQHPMNHLSTGLLKMESHPEKPQEKYTVIGSDVWIGLNAVVMNGVHIGHGAVIGAGAIVTKDVPPYAIVGGVPAKIIKYRFDEEIINDLLELKWWELDPVFIQSLPKDDIKRCIELMKKNNIN